MLFIAWRCLGNYSDTFLYEAEGPLWLFLLNKAISERSGNMGWLWKEIAPMDRFKVACNGILHEYDRKVLTLLYQPLIGPVPFTLYLTLWARVEANRLWSDYASHHELMDFMGLNLRDLRDARLKLEGISLLKTYVRKENDHRLFIYVLQPPMSPAEFFNHEMLSVYLYRKIGKSQFLQLRQFFSDKSVQSLQGYREITRAFEDIYESAPPGSVDYTPSLEERGEMEGRMLIGRGEAGKIQVGPGYFDFDLLLAGLSETLVPRRLITKPVKEAIYNLSYLYGIDPLEMKNLLLSSIDEETGEIDIEKLRKEAKDWYQLENHDRLPMLVDKIQPAIYREGPDQPKTREEKLIHYLENTSPRQLLSDFQGGGEPSAADLKIVEDVMFTKKLSPGVVNVLLHYVLNQANMKLSKAYVDTIASHWARKEIKTVKEAIELIKKEGQKFSAAAAGKKMKQAGTAKPVRTEIIPDWFDKSEEEKKAEIMKQEIPNFEERKRRLEEKLKKFRK